MIIYNNKMNKTHQSNFFKKKLLFDNSQRLTPEHSIASYTFKNARSTLFNKTSNLFFSNRSTNNTIKNNKFTKLISNEKLVNITSKKIHKSLSELFKNNDIDFVRNLNIDSFSQFDNNLNSKENKFSIFGKIKYNIGQDEIKAINNRFQMINRNSINKSYNNLKKNKRKLELNESVEKDMMNRYKILKKDDKINNLKKKEYYLRIKEIDKKINDIKEENIFIKAIYLKELKEQPKDKNKKMDVLDKIIKYKVKMKENNTKNNKSILHALDMKFSNNKNQTNNNNLDICEINQIMSEEKKKFNNLIKMQENKINELLSEKKNIESLLKKIGGFLEEIKKEMKELSDKLMMSYKESLHKGTNVKNEGLAWLIKSIWDLGQNVPMSFMPDFLDCESIDYLFKLARKKNLIEILRNQINEIKTKLKKKLDKNHVYLNPLLINDNKNNNEYNNKNISVKEKLLLIMEKESKMLKNEMRIEVYNDLVNKFKKNKIKFEISKLPETQIINKLNEEIEKIKKEIDDLKQKEINRIFNCFLKQNYENKFHTNIETVLAALIGYEEEVAEVDKFKSLKKNYIANSNHLRFFVHNYTKKIIPAV